MKKFLPTFIAIAATQIAGAQCPVPSLASASPSVLCAPGGTVNLNATAFNSNINWYSVPAGGIAIGSSSSGSNFNTNAASTTTYYAEAFLAATNTTQVFSYTGGMQTFTVPAGVTTLTVDLWGAQGGYSFPSGNNVLPGYGGQVTGTIAVTQGQVLQIFVGGIGGNGAANSGGTGGYNGGGSGGTEGGNYSGAGGGGGSDIRISPYTLGDRVAIAGGGGGAGFDCDDDNGGAGGGLVGGDGIRCGGDPDGIGLGGTQSLGGIGTLYPGYCAGNNGALGIGGDGGACTNAGGGGGGGYYGGGGGAWGGGGGGSSYLVNGIHAQGVQTGNGQVDLSYMVAPCTSVSRTSVVVTVITPTISVNSGSICSGSSFTITPSGANTYTIQGGNTVVSPTVTTNYSVTGTTAEGCVTQQAATSGVTVNALPSVSVTGGGTVCAGQSATLTASGANTYSWNTGAVTAAAIVSPGTTTNYTATGTSSEGCSSVVTVNLVVDQCTGLAEVNSALNGLMVYPNPNNGEFKIELVNGLEKNISVTDVTGKVVYTYNGKNDQLNINIKDLASGVYFVKIQSDNASSTLKMVRQ